MLRTCGLAWFIAVCHVPAALAGTPDRFGVEQLFATIPGGREWSAHWEKARVVPAYEIDPEDAAFRNEEGSLNIAGGIATAPAGMTRLVVLTPKDGAGKYTQPLWQNVEMTIYARRSSGSG